jgi:hypothetical protein
MRLRLSILGGSVAGAYAAGALLIASGETHGDGCMGFCFGIATFPEVLLLALLPTAFFYSPAWTGLLMWLFLIGTIGLNTFILYVVFGGVAWWRDNNAA